MSSDNFFRFLNCGDNAITVEFGNEISPKINAEVRALVDALTKKSIRGVTDIIPSYRSVLVVFNPEKTKHGKIQSAIKSLLPKIKNSDVSKKNIHIIPVCYDDEFAPDIDNVCSHTGLEKEDIIQIHSSTDYLIYMLGFLPGFPYLGGLDRRLHTPRLQSPRTTIPEGSVGIGGEQTGIYPSASPGGWQLIGRTPVKIYDSKREKPILFSAGDLIRFKPISSDEYYEIKNAVDNDLYEYKTVKG